MSDLCLNFVIIIYILKSSIFMTQYPKVLFTMNLPFSFVRILAYTFSTVTCRLGTHFVYSAKVRTQPAVSA